MYTEGVDLETCWSVKELAVEQAAPARWAAFLPAVAQQLCSGTPGTSCGLGSDRCPQLSKPGPKGDAWPGAGVAGQEVVVVVALPRSSLVDMGAGGSS